MKIIPYNPASESAANLAAALGVKRVRKEGRPLAFNGHLINWGCSSINRQINASKGVLNTPFMVRNASNKKNTFTSLVGNKDVGKHLPVFTDDRSVAVAWQGAGRVVVERHVLNGHSGEGIKIKKPGDEIEQAPLYTVYIKKKEEYRIHVINGNVVFVQRKARKLDVDDDKVNWEVRNLAGGFIYANEGVDVPQLVKDFCIEAIKTLGLDFGAVDVVYNEHQNNYFILEVNTAPGLAGRTLDAYVKAFNAIR